MKRTIVLTAGALLLASVVGALVAGRALWTRIQEPYQGSSEAEQFIDIPSGAGSTAIGRRLVEAGVRCVTIDHSNWDTHDGNFATLKNQLLPQLDPALATLLSDLADRSLLAKTLVVVTGEFGRTPRINKNAGRDHWGPSFTVLLAGGGIQGGRVIGTSDERAERPADEPHGPEDLFATIAHVMGIDPNDEFLTPEGRPVKIVNNGKVIRGLL